MTESFAGEPVEADVAGMQTELDSSLELVLECAPCDLDG